jgi:hypothetical protein
MHFETYIILKYFKITILSKQDIVLFYIISFVLLILLEMFKKFKLTTDVLTIIHYSYFNKNNHNS